jgi:hypothetical protein
LLLPPSLPGFFAFKRPMFRFSIDEPVPRPSPKTFKQGGKALKCDLSLIMGPPKVDRGS